MGISSSVFVLDEKRAEVLIEDATKENLEQLFKCKISHLEEVTVSSPAGVTSSSPTISSPSSPTGIPSSLPNSNTTSPSSSRRGGDEGGIKSGQRRKASGQAADSMESGSDSSRGVYTRSPHRPNPTHTSPTTTATVQATSKTQSTTPVTIVSCFPDKKTGMFKGVKAGRTYNVCPLVTNLSIVRSLSSLSLSDGNSTEGDSEHSVDATSPRRRLSTNSLATNALKNFIPFAELTFIDGENPLDKQGGQGKVAAAKWLGKLVAVKSLRGYPSSEEDFLAEVENMSNLRHPNIIQLFGWSSDGDKKYIVMEYLPYGDLSEALQNSDMLLDWPLLLRFIDDIVSGMVYLHSKNIIHCDLKLENILLVNDTIDEEPEQAECCKIIDFGIARHFDDEGNGDLAGTLGYMAPEYYESHKSTFAGDTFAFGMVLCGMLTRKPIWDDVDPFDRQDFIAKGAMPEVPTWTPREVRSLIEDCWKADPNKRPTFAEIKRRIETLQQQSASFPSLFLFFPEDDGGEEVYAAVREVKLLGSVKVSIFLKTGTQTLNLAMSLDDTPITVRALDIDLPSSLISHSLIVGGVGRGKKSGSPDRTRTLRSSVSSSLLGHKHRGRSTSGSSSTPSLVGHVIDVEQQGEAEKKKRVGLRLAQSTDGLATMWTPITSPLPSRHSNVDMADVEDGNNLCIVLTPNEVLKVLKVGKGTKDVVKLLNLKMRDPQAMRMHINIRDISMNVVVNQESLRLKSLPLDGRIELSYDFITLNETIEFGRLSQAAAEWEKYQEIASQQHGSQLFPTLSAIPLDVMNSAEINARRNSHKNNDNDNNNKESSRQGSPKFPDAAGSPRSEPSAENALDPGSKAKSPVASPETTKSEIVTNASLSQQGTESTPTSTLATTMSSPRKSSLQESRVVPLGASPRKSSADAATTTMREQLSSSLQMPSFLSSIFSSDSSASHTSPSSVSSARTPRPTSPRKQEKSEEVTKSEKEDQVKDLSKRKSTRHPDASSRRRGDKRRSTSTKRKTVRIAAEPAPAALALDLADVVPVDELPRDAKPFIFKVIILGNSGVGKSSILMRFTENSYRQDMKATIGVDFRIKNYLVRDQPVRVQFWDTAGQERYRTLTGAYYRGLNGAVITYDITNRRSFDDVATWLEDLRHSSGNERTYAHITKLVVGNRLDLAEQRMVPPSATETYINKGMLFAEVSAKSGTGVHDALLRLVKELFDRNERRLRRKELKRQGKDVGGKDSSGFDEAGKGIVKLQAHPPPNLRRAGEVGCDC